MRVNGWNFEYPFKVARPSIFVGAPSNFDPPSHKQLDSNYIAYTTVATLQAFRNAVRS